MCAEASGGHPWSFGVSHTSELRVLRRPVESAKSPGIPEERWPPWSPASETYRKWAASLGRTWLAEFNPEKKNRGRKHKQHKSG